MGFPTPPRNEFVSIMLATLSAGAYAAALPNEIVSFGSPLIGLFALIPLYFAFYAAPGTGAAIRSGAIFGVVSTLLSNYWLGNFGEFSVWTLGGPTLAYTAYNSLLAVAFVTLMRLPGGARPLAFAATWTGYELLKSIGYLGYPWGLAAYTFGDVLPLMQIADITGVYGLSFLVVYANATLAELVAGRRLQKAALPGPIEGRRGPSLPVPHRRRPQPLPLRHACLVAALFAGAFGYGAFRLSNQPGPVDTLRPVLVQPNTDSWEPGNLDTALTILQELSLGALDGDRDVLIWSENSLSLPYREYRDSYFARNPSALPFTEFVAGLEVPLLTGSPYLPFDSRNLAWNAVVLIEPGSGDLIERYGKRRLVPFAEHIPFWEVPVVRRFFENVVGLRTVWTPADERVLFELPTRNGTTRAGVPISFEGAFAPLVRDFTRGGANVIINMTNNSWSQTDSAQYQQFVVTRFRAIESRRPLLLATVSGLTSVVDISGAKTDSLPMFEEAALSADVPIYDRESLTVYHRLGDLFAWLMLLAAAVSILYATRGRWTSRSPEYGPHNALEYEETLKTGNS